MRLAEPSETTCDPQEQTESSDSESLELSRSPDVNIAIPRPPSHLDTPSHPRNGDNINHANTLVRPIMLNLSLFSIIFINLLFLYLIYY